MNSLLSKFIKNEIRRQEETVNLIASENYASPAVLEILGSPLTNKYSEGYPGRRYYPGCRFYDEIENLAKELALKNFKLNPSVWSVNVQPYSGTPANLAVYLALMKPACPPKPGRRRRGDVLMGMELSAGGHLSHGHKAGFSGKLFRSVSYGVDKKTGLIDYRCLERLAKKHRPKIVVSGASAYPRKIDFKKFGAIAEKVGAYHLADISHIAGLVAAGVHPSPFPYADVVTTTTHKTLRGPRAAVVFSGKSEILNPKSETNPKPKTQNPKLTIADAIDKAVFPGFQGGPHNNVIAAAAQCFGEALKPSFKNYARQVVKNARVLAQSLKERGFQLVTGGTDNHLILIDLKSLGFNGAVAEAALEKAGIVANRNVLVGDRSPLSPSGLRLGTPAATTRGMKEREMAKVAELIYRTLVLAERAAVREEVKKLCRRFPVER